jgi:plastocyanin
MIKTKWLLLFLIAVFMSACVGQKSTQDPVVNSPSIGVQITKDLCPSIEVQSGMQVEWTNIGNEDRALLLERKDENGNLVDFGGTDLLQPGSSFSITLIESGEYIYYCSIDHTSYGSITVSP